MRAPLIIILLSSLLCIASCASQQNSNIPTTAKDLNQVTVNVGLCEILQSPEKWERKVVRVKAVFCDCFENPTIYSSKCTDQKKVWVQGSFNKCKNAGRMDAFRSKASKDPGDQMWGGWNFGIIAVGRLTGTKGGYGHMNAYDYLFEVDCLEHAELLDRIGGRPQPNTEEQRRIEAFQK